ncbi:MAG: hypothetical protein ACOH1X_01660 [Kaistella sp.]
MKKIFAIKLLFLVSFYNAQYERQPRKYGEYVEPYDLGLTYKVLKKSESMYNHNAKIIQEKNNQIRSYIKFILDTWKYNKKIKGNEEKLLKDMDYYLNFQQ